MNSRTFTPSKGGDPAARSRTATLLRLHPNHPLHLHHPPLITQLAKMISGADGSHGVTGGVYKVRERIHRVVLIRDY
jgi:hypothetical protein